MSTYNQSVSNRKRSRSDKEEMTAEEYERKIFMMRLFRGHMPYDTLLEWVMNDDEYEDEYGVLACFEEDGSGHTAKKRRSVSPEPVELLWGGDEAGIKAFLDECMRDGEEEEKKEEEQEEDESEDEAEYFDAVEASSPAERSDDEEEAFYDAEEDFINPL